MTRFVDGLTLVFVHSSRSRGVLKMRCFTPPPDKNGYSLVETEHGISGRGGRRKQKEAAPRKKFAVV